MSKGRHRGVRRRRPPAVRDFLLSLWFALWRPRYSVKRMRRATPAQIQRVGLTMADAIAAASTSYRLAEPCPWGLSAGACALWHPIDHPELIGRQLMTHLGTTAF